MVNVVTYLAEFKDKCNSSTKDSLIPDKTRTCSTNQAMLFNYKNINTTFFASKLAAVGPSKAAPMMIISYFDLRTRLNLMIGMHRTYRIAV